MTDHRYDSLPLGEAVARIRRFRALAEARYAWPGGYDIVFACADGGLVCAACVADPSNGYMVAGYPSERVIVAVSTADWIDGSYSCDDCARELCPYVDDAEPDTTADDAQEGDS